MSRVLCVANQKGGVGKTTTSINLAAGLAKAGHATLLVDLDPQCNATTGLGLQPTMRHPLVHHMPLADSVFETYADRLHVLPGSRSFRDTNEIVRGVEHRQTLQYHLGTAADAYAYVVIDCPPQLGFLTMSALSASSGVLVTVHPQMLDLMSMSQFLRMTADLLGVIRDAGANLRFDWLRFLPTRYKVGDAPQTEVIAFIRGLFGRSVLTNHMVESTAISDAGLTKQTLYEADKKDFTRQTFDRAIESMNAVNDEIAAIIQNTWGRNGKKA